MVVLPEQVVPMRITIMATSFAGVFGNGARKKVWLGDLE
jgi:hypothetical protein